MTAISRRDALNVAADVLERSDWLTIDLLADLGDENAGENADRIVEILRELAAEDDPIETPLEAATASYLEAVRQRDEAVATIRALAAAYRNLQEVFVVITSTAERRLADLLNAERGGVVDARALYGQASNPVPANVPPPSAATGAPTPLPQADLTEAYRVLAEARRDDFARGVVGPDVEVLDLAAERRTSGPLDPEIHAALVRAVERSREAVRRGALPQDVPQ